MSGASQPLLPTPKEGDPEDVSWALQTADALWKRGEYADAVSWIRKAANAASEAEADMRVIELAKAAAELSALVEAFGAPEPRIPSAVGIDIDVDVAVEASPSPAIAEPAPKKPPGPPPRKPSPRLPTPNPVPSPLREVPFAEVASAATMDEPFAAPPIADPVPPSYDPDCARAFPSVPPSPPDYAPTPLAMPVAKSVPPDREPPPPKVAIAPERSQRTSTMPLGTPDPSYVPVRRPEPPKAMPFDPEATAIEDSFVPAIEVPQKPGRPASGPPPAPSSSRNDDVITSARSAPPPRPTSAGRLGTPVMGSVPPPRMSLAPSAIPTADDDEGVQKHVSDAPPRAAHTNVQIPAPPRAPTIKPVAPPPPSSAVPRAATLAGFPSRPPPAAPALAAPMSGRAVLLDPEQFEVLADVPDDAREALVMQSEKLALLPDESAPAPAMIIVLQGECEVRARNRLTHLDAIAQGQVRLLVAFAPAEGELDIVGGPKGARYLALGISAIELLRAAAPWVVQELEPASDDVHVVAGILRGRHGNKLDGPMLDAVLGRAKTMRLAPDAKVVQQGEAVRALIFVGAGELTIRAGDDPDSSILETLTPGEVLFSTELLARAAAPATVRAGPRGALVIVATRSATEEMLVTVPPLLELLGEA